MEQSAIEAMLHLSQPKQSTSPRDTNSETMSILTPDMKFQHTHLNPSFHVYNNNSNNIQHPTTVSNVTADKPTRPNAMSLSALLTDDSSTSQPKSILNPISSPTTTHFPSPPSNQQQQYAPPTEPVTPPFSPTVLPSLSAAGLTRPPTLQQSQQQPLPSLSRSMERSPLSNLPSSTMTNRVMSNGLTMTSGTSSQSTNSIPPKRVMKRPYKKYYSNPTPSSHCHVCARTSKAVKFAICARIKQGLCRKVTCFKCFTKFGWDWEAAVDNTEWICVHCRGECPEERSQCYIYSRVNSKRESKRGLKKNMMKNRSGISKIGQSQNMIMSGFNNLPLPNTMALENRGAINMVGNGNSRQHHINMMNRNGNGMRYAFGNGM